MAALSVLFESGIQCPADRPERYLGSPAELFFRDLSASWETSEVLEADPGHYAVIARKSNMEGPSNGDWYLGAICNEKHSATIQLNFLDADKTYYAIICADGESKDELTSRITTVKRGDTLELNMLKAGGAAVRFMSTEPVLPKTLELNRNALEMKELTGETLTVTAFDADGSEILVLTFRKGWADLAVCMRAYDDGYAFRYDIRKLDGSKGPMIITDETSAFTMPAGSDIYTMRDTRSGGTFNHEESFDLMKVEDIPTVTGNTTGRLSMPLLSKSPDDVWTLITEANLYGDPYVGSFLNRVEGTTLEIDIPRQQMIKMGTWEIKTAYPFTSPWRLAICGGLGDIVESTMVENVSDPSVLEDTSWIKPGVSSWTWLVSYAAGQHDYEEILKYVDFASEMGWSYYIMDEGWQPPSTVSGKRYDGYYEWFDELVQHAEEKNVGLIAWILAHDLDTPEEREVLKEYAEKGIKGIKVDFFDYDDQDTIQLYQEIYEACVENHLIVNAHGANKPTGEARTYPTAKPSAARKWAAITP